MENVEELSDNIENKVNELVLCCFSCDVLQKCRKATNITQLILKDEDHNVFNQKARPSGARRSGKRPWLVDICSICPDLKHVDLTGCSENTKYVMLGSPTVKEFSIKDVSIDSDVTVIDYAENIEAIREIYIILYNQQSRKQRLELAVEVISREDAKGYTNQIREAVNQKLISQYLAIWEWAILHLASYAGDVELINILVHQGVDVNAKDQYEVTAVWYAATSEVMNTLVTLGADINVFKENVYDGENLLMYHCKKDSIDVIRLLIENGADVNVRDIYCKRSALFFSQSEYVTRLLIESGADIEICDSRGRNCLFYSTNGSILLDLIESGIDVNCRTKYSGKTILFGLTAKGLCNIVGLLVESGVDIKTVDRYGRTCLFYVTDPEVVRVLVSNGANINARDNMGRTPLYHAIQHLLSSDSADLLHTLIDCGATLDVKDNCNVSVLSYLIHLMFSEYLTDCEIDWECDICFTNNILEDPTTTGCPYPGYNRYVVMEEVENERFFQWCCNLEECCTSSSNRLNEIFRLLAALGFTSDDICKELVDASLSAFISIWPQVIPVGYFLNTFREIVCHFESAFGSNKSFLNKLFVKILVIALREQSTEWSEEIQVHVCVLHVLLNSNASPNAPDHNGNTALHHAVRLPFHFSITYLHLHLPEIFDLLVGHGAIINRQNHRQETPLLYLFRIISEEEEDKMISVLTGKTTYGWQALIDVLHFLIEHGANLNLVTNLNLVDKWNMSINEYSSVFQFAIRLCFKSYYMEDNGLLERVHVQRAAIELFILLFQEHRAGGEAFRITDDRGNTLLHMWASFGYQMIVSQGGFQKVQPNANFEKFVTVFGKIILKRMSVNIRNYKAQTPLHLARTCAAVDLLLNSGANPKVIDEAGDSPLHVWLKRQAICVKPVWYKEGKMKSGGLILLHPIININFSIIIQNGFDPWVVNANGESILTLILRNESFESAKELLDVGIQVTQPGSHLTLSNGDSPLHIICKDNHTRNFWKISLIDILLKEKRHSPSVADKSSNTPLHYACRQVMRTGDLSSVHGSVVERLLQYGADIHGEDNEGKSCLDVATDMPELKELLLKDFDIEDIPAIIPWSSKSDRYKPFLKLVARSKKVQHIELYCFYEEPIGSGTFGHVFAGICEKDGREVAVKRMEKARLSRPEFRREIKNLVELKDCEQVVKYLCYHEDQHFVYMVLELMEGNLEEYHDDICLDPQNNVELCKEIVLGLHFLHAYGIIHRDIKPQNILFKYSPRLCLKIADFGLSTKVHTCSTMTTTVMHPTAGTRCWMSSELLTAKDVPKHSNASDVFACGLVLHYLFYNKKHPFAPSDTAKGPIVIQNETESNILHGKLLLDPNLDCGSRSPSLLDSSSHELCHLLRKMLLADKNQRPTAEEVLSHLFFWSNEEKVKFLEAVGNQPEIQCSRFKRKEGDKCSVEKALEINIGSQFTVCPWDRLSPVMTNIHAEMTSGGRAYETTSAVALIRFIRNAYAHVSDRTRPTPFQEQLLQHFVFFIEFPMLVIEVYEVVTNHGWDKNRKEVEYAIKMK